MKELAGRIGRNLRQGHRAELVGIDFLRSFCAVAQVPQSEDIGFDAIATLLREEGLFLYAEESFCVQFKAQSVRTIGYSEHEYEWFHSLKMPLYIGSVDLSRQEIALHTTHWPASHVNAIDFNSAVFHLDQMKGNLTGEVLQLWLGPPILQWTMEQGESSDYKKLARKVLANWLAIDYANLRLRHIRTRESVYHWETNVVPGQAYYAALHSPEEISQDLEAAMPYLQKIAAHIFSSTEDGQANLQALGLYLLATWFQAHDVIGSQSLVQMTAQKLGVFNGEFQLQLNMERSSNAEEVRKTDSKPT